MEREYSLIKRRNVSSIDRGKYLYRENDRKGYNYFATILDDLHLANYVQSE